MSNVIEKVMDLINKYKNESCRSSALLRPGGVISQHDLQSAEKNISTLESIHTALNALNMKVAIDLLEESMKKCRENYAYHSFFSRTGSSRSRFLQTLETIYIVVASDYFPRKTMLMLLAFRDGKEKLKLRNKHSALTRSLGETPIGDANVFSIIKKYHG